MEKIRGISIIEGRDDQACYIDKSAKVIDNNSRSEQRYTEITGK
jgi:hypothetical protein